jgi:hypothetical protein
MAQTWKYEPPVNGGLYTGEPFKGPWKNYPAMPMTSYLNHVNLRSANPPLPALFQMAPPLRPGNNDTDAAIPGVTQFVGDKDFGPYSGILCIPCFKKAGCTCEHNCGGHNQKCGELGCPIKWLPID